MHRWVLTIIVLAATVTLANPLATAGWLLGGGAVEPSTAFDVPTLMWPDANTAVGLDGRGIDRAYFNAYLLSYAGANLGVTYDPNLDGGSVMSPAANYAAAMLGFWRDCNRDGYVGWKGAPTAYGSFSSYPLSVGGPIDQNLCPPGSAYWPENPETGAPSQMVDEFRWIGRAAGCDATEAGCPGSGPTSPVLCVPPNQQPPTDTGLCAKVPRRDQTPGGHNDVSDTFARVWGDWERPGHPHVAFADPLVGFPRGTFDDADGTMSYVDAAAFNLPSEVVPAWGLTPNVGACDQPNPTLLGGETGSCGLWPAWQTRRVVNDTTCETERPEDGDPPGCSEPDPLVRTWDTERDDDGDGNPCNDGFFLSVPNPSSGQQVVRGGIPNLEPQADANLLADGSLSGSLEHQQRALLWGGVVWTRHDEGPGACGSGNGIADPLEYDRSANALRHVQPQMVLNFTTDVRYQHAAFLGFYDVPVNEYGNLGGGASGTALRQPGWYSNTYWTSRPPRQTWGSVTSVWTTFYADVTPEAFATSGASPADALPAGGQDRHFYGMDACTATTTGSESLIDPATQWECNFDEWRSLRASYGNTNRLRHAAILGDVFDLRDVDCYDNSLSHQGVLWDDELRGVRAGGAACPAW